jgi:plasmid maintenance system antidote protein VapI
MNPLSLIPAPYRILVGIALVASLLGFTYYKGYSKGRARADTEVAAYVTKLTEKALIIERQQARINELVNDSTHDKIDTVKVRVAHNVPVPVPGPTVYLPDTTTRSLRVELPIGWVSVHNASARNDNADSALAANAEASGVTPNDALRFIVQNYGVCQENAIRLESLQNWIKQTQLNVEQANKKPR